LKKERKRGAAAAASSIKDGDESNIVLNTAEHMPEKQYILKKVICRRPFGWY